MVCTNCGKSLSNSASFCGTCGASLKSNKASDNQPKQKTIKFPTIPKVNLNLNLKSKLKTLRSIFLILVITYIAFILLTNSSINEFKIEKGVLTEYNGNKYAITTPEKATEIGEWAFVDRRAVKTITLNDTVTRINNGAFEGCTSLTMITIPENVTHIGDWILAECWSLKTVCVKAGSYADAWARSYDFHSNVTIEYYS